MHFDQRFLRELTLEVQQHDSEILKNLFIDVSVLVSLACAIVKISTLSTPDTSTDTFFLLLDTVHFPPAERYPVLDYLARNFLVELQAVVLDPRSKNLQDMTLLKQAFQFTQAKLWPRPPTP